MTTRKQQFRILEQILRKNKNLKLKDIKKKFSVYEKISERELRRLIYEHRVLSSNKFIVAGDYGYNLVSRKSKEFVNWLRRYEKYVSTHTNLLFLIKK